MRTVADYIALIPAENRGQPDFEAVLALVLAPFADIAAFHRGLPEAFDIDEAVGVQLDKVGEWVGYTRYVPYPLPTAWFSLGDAARGLGKGRWHRKEDPVTGITTLDDDIYRDLLRAKAILNEWDGSVPGAVLIYAAFLPDASAHPFVEDRQDGTSVVGISGEIPSLQKLTLLAAGYLPVRPVGTRSSVRVTSVNQAPILGLGADNAFIGGLGRGAWGVTPDQLVARGY